MTERADRKWPRRITAWLTTAGDTAVWDYSFAFATTGVALAISLLLPDEFNPNSFFLFFVAVIVIARYTSSIGPGLLAAVVGVVATWYFLLTPTQSFAFSNPTVQITRLIGMLLVLVLITFMSHTLRRERQQASRARQVAEGAHDAAELARQVAERAQEAAEMSQQAAVAAGAREQVAVQEQLRLRDEAISELSTPTLEIRRGVLVLPLIGALDAARADRLTKRLTDTIQRSRARVVVIDITGVPNFDSVVATHLIEAVKIARLLGAEVITSGVSADVSTALVGIEGFDVDQLRWAADLQDGLQMAEALVATPANSSSAASPRLTSHLPPRAATLWLGRR